MTPITFRHKIAGRIARNAMVAIAVTAIFGFRALEAGDPDYAAGAATVAFAR